MSTLWWASEKNDAPLRYREKYRKISRKVFIQQLPCELCGKVAKWRYCCKGPIEGTQIVHDYCDRHSELYKVQKY